MTGDEPNAESPPTAVGADGTAGFRLFLVAAAAVALAFVAALRQSPPDPLPADAPAAEFSAARAERVLRDLVGDDVPHPLGSPAHDAMRDRVVVALRAAGAEVDVETSFEHLSRAGFAHLANVVATVAGTEPGPPTLVLAHYDSVAAGPGAGDDAASVAVMAETIRVLRDRPPRHAVRFVVTDGEEAGLLGAFAYDRRHRGEEFRGVINLEARGNAGPSLLFETGPGDLAAARAFGERAPRPVGSSLFAAVYRRMPNDTDFTVFRDAHPGLNFASVGRPRHYHTALDRAANVDARMLQHHGENAVAAIRAFDETDIDGDGPGGVWFTPFGLTVVGWPVGAALYVAGVCAALLLVACAIAIWRGAFRGAGLAWALAATWGGVALAGGAVAGVGSALAPDTVFVAEPGWTVGAVACAALGVAWLLHAALARYHTAFAAIVASAALWTVLAVALSIVLPEASHMAVVPALAASTVALVAALRGAASPALAAVPALVVPPLFLPLTGPLTDALGLAFGCAAAAPVVLAGVTTVTAYRGGRRWLLPLAACGIAAFCAFRAAGAPLVTAELPGRLSFVHVAETESDGHRHERVALDDHGDGLPPLPELTGPAPQYDAMVPWTDAPVPIVDAAETRIEPPSLDRLTVRTEGGSRRVRFRLVSRRGAPDVRIIVDPKARFRRATVDGVVVPAETLPRAGRGARQVRCLTTPPGGVEVELEFADETRVSVFVADVSSGLPPADAPLVAKRPRDRVPSHSGDRTIAYRRMDL